MVDDYQTTHEEYLKVHEEIVKEPRLQSISRAERSLYRAFFSDTGYPFETRYNAIAWAFDCFTLVREIVFSYCWMKAHAKSGRVTRDGSTFQMQYYADNCITRINSFRDKAALLAWSYYCGFNPEDRQDVLTHKDIVQRLRYPPRFGLAITSQAAFLTELEKLDAACFGDAKRYRDRKIHRMEPKLLMHAPTQSDGFAYMIPVYKGEDKKRFEAEMKEMYPDATSRRRVRDSCHVGGVLYECRTRKEEYWHYAKVESFTKDCLLTCVEVADRLARILKRRAPLRGRG